MHTSGDRRGIHPSKDCEREKKMRKTDKHKAEASHSIMAINLTQAQIAVTGLILARIAPWLFRQVACPIMT